MVPNLRFIFNDDYKEIKLKNICTITGGYAFDSTKMKSSGEYQIVKMSNLYNGILDLSRNPSFINNPSLKELDFMIKDGDILITLTGTVNKRDYGYTVQIESQEKLLINQRCALIKAKNINPKYLFYLLNTKTFLNQFYSASTGGTGNQTNVSTKDMLNFKILVPKIDEQYKIGTLLAKIDEHIKTQSKIIEDLQLLKKRISTILFDVYSRKCSFYSLEDLVSTESIKEFQVQTRDYLIDGTFEVVDQGKKEIIGYSNDSNRLYTKTPVIIYGDHTTIVKYRDKPFIIGGDGVKLLKAKSGFLQKYIYYVICQYNISSEGYKRHWHILKNILVPVPDYEKQKNIVNILDSFNNKIKNEKKILVKYKKQKDYLLKNMFI